MEFQQTEMIVPSQEKLVHRTFRGIASALAALMIFPSGAAMSLDMNKNARRPTPATSSHEAPKSAFKRKSLGPGNYYLNIIVYCRDSNEMRTFFCFWITRDEQKNERFRYLLPEMAARRFSSTISPAR